MMKNEESGRSDLAGILRGACFFLIIVISLGDLMGFFQSWKGEA